VRHSPFIFLIGSQMKNTQIVLALSLLCSCASFLLPAAPPSSVDADRGYVPEHERVYPKIIGGCHGIQVDFEGNPVIQLNSSHWIFADSFNGTALVSEGMQLLGVDSSPSNSRLLMSYQKYMEQVPCVTVSSKKDMKKLRMNTFSKVDPNANHVKGNLVLLIRFSDHIDRELPTQKEFETLFNAEQIDDTNRHIIPTGSITSYFKSQSYGKVHFDNVIVGWIDVPFSEEEVAMGCSGLCVVDGVSTLHEAIKAAVYNASAQVNFSSVDLDEDQGDLDGLTIIHSGIGAEWNSNQSHIWSHKWGFSPILVHGVSVGRYSINTGIFGSSPGKIARIGAMAHEMSHQAFGLPDLYDQTSTPALSATLNIYDIMSNAWGPDGSQLYMGSFSPWCKVYLGWADIIDLDTPGTKYLEHSQINGQIYRLTKGFPSNEYLLIESRSNSSAVSAIDSLIPAGIYVYHIDINVQTFNNEASWPGQTDWPQVHNMVRMIQSDNKWDMEKNEFYSLDYNDGYIREDQVLSDFSLPSLLSYEQMSKTVESCTTSGNQLDQFKFSNTGISSFEYSISDPVRCSSDAMGNELHVLPINTSTNDTLTWVALSAGTVVVLAIGLLVVKRRNRDELPIISFPSDVSPKGKSVEKPAPEDRQSDIEKPLSFRIYDWLNSDGKDQATSSFDKVYSWLFNEEPAEKPTQTRYPKKPLPKPPV